MKFLKEDINNKNVKHFYIPHVYEEGCAIDEGNIYKYKEDDETLYGYETDSFGDDKGFEDEEDALNAFKDMMDNEFLNDWGYDYDVVFTREEAKRIYDKYNKNFDTYNEALKEDIDPKTNDTDELWAIWFPYVGKRVVTKEQMIRELEGCLNTVKEGGDINTGFGLAFRNIQTISDYDGKPLVPRDDEDKFFETMRRDN